MGGSAIHNGADDNASGVAGLLRLAERLKNSAYQASNYLIIAFSGEELGLFGSKHFIEHPTLPLDQINYVLNMDMIGRLDPDKTLLVSGTGTSSLWETIISLIQIDGIKAQTSKSGMGASDHATFYKKNIPVLNFSTGQRREYHRPDDDTHLINFEGIRSITDYLFEVIKITDGYPPLDFQVSHEGHDLVAVDFKVSLGVLPDYAFRGTGMKIETIIEDRPAQKAGIENDDIILKIEDSTINDIYAYMEALSKYKKGDQVEITIKRGTQKLTKKVIF